MEKLPISIGILSWNSNKTIANTLESYKKNGLLDIVNDVTILFQNIRDSDKELSEKYSIPFIGLNLNVGIGKGFIELAKNCKTENILLLEHDWVLIENQEITYKRLKNGLDLINSDFKAIRYRHRKEYGEPLCSRNIYEGNELNVYDPVIGLHSPHLSDSIHWTEEPEKMFSDKIQKIDEHFVTTSRWMCFTNNPVLYKKSFYIEIVSPFTGSGIQLENNISKWWANQNFKVAHGEGLFTHRDLDKYRY